HEVRRYDRVGSARPAQDAIQNVLRIANRIWRRAEHTHLSNLPWTARRVAGDESGGVTHDRADGTHARLRYCTGKQVRSQKLLLPGYAEKLSDFTVRHAVVYEWQRTIA